VKTSIDLPFPAGWSQEKGCGHGKLWEERCDDCEIVSLTDSLSRMEPQVKRDRAKLDRLLWEKSVADDGRVSFVDASGNENL
jgi:hypothetical protein